MPNRVVITGMGLMTPVGTGVEEFWSNLTAGRSGIDRISQFDTEDCSVKIGGEVRFDLSGHIAPAKARKMSRISRLGVVAAKLAIHDSGLVLDEAMLDSLDLFLGVASPDMDIFRKAMERRLKRGLGNVDPTAPAVLVTAAPAANISVELGIKGEVITISTGCSSSTNAIGHAFRKLVSGQSRIALAGGTDSGIQAELLACYARANMLSTRNDSPKEACRPFEANRDGHVLSETAGLLLLEDYEHAKARGAHVYAELRGYSCTSDAYSMHAINEDVSRASESMKQCLEQGRIGTDELDYYCAHGSASMVSDKRETHMLKSALKSKAYGVQVSSVKSMTGHPFGASGVLQTAVCALAIEKHAIPPTINYEQPDPECDLDYVPNEARDAIVKTAATYALGMGGNNAALVLSAC